MCGTCERRGRSGEASASSGAAKSAAGQAVADYNDAVAGGDDTALSPSVQRSSDALERLIDGRLGDDESSNAEAVIMGRRMGRVLLEASNAAYSRGYRQGLGDDAADVRDLAHAETLELLDEARPNLEHSKWGEGPGLIQGHDSPLFTNRFGGSEWYQRQVEAGIAPWDDVHVAARQLLQTKFDNNHEVSAKTIGRLGLAFKDAAEDAASYLMRASLIKSSLD